MLFSLCFMLLIVMCLVLERKVTRERNAMNGDSSFADSMRINETFAHPLAILPPQSEPTVFMKVTNGVG